MMSKAELARKAGLSTLTIDRVEAGRPVPPRHEAQGPARARSASRPTRTGCSSAGRGRLRVSRPLGSTQRPRRAVLARGRRRAVLVPGKVQVDRRPRHRLLVGEGRRAARSRRKGIELLAPRRREASARGDRAGRLPELERHRRARSARRSRSADIKSKHVAAAVSGHSVIVKKISLPAMTREELDESIRWEAEQYIPFDVNEVNLDFQILERRRIGEGQMDVLLVAAKKDLIDDYVQVISEAGLDAGRDRRRRLRGRERLRGQLRALRRDEVVALVNIGAQVVNINIVSRTARRPSRATSRPAATQYTEEIQKALSISFDEAERIKIGGSRHGEQPGRRAAGSRAGDAQRHRHGDRRDQPLARLLRGDRGREPHQPRAALRRRFAGVRARERRSRARRTCRSSA